jgi:periodic tryptophan protein 1
MLVGNDSEMLGNRLDEEGMPVEDIPEDEKDEQDDEGGGEEDDEDDDDDDDDEEEDDLADVPDTREFMPVDIAGLEAMGIGHVGFNEEEDDDDDSDAEDVNLSPDDAIVIVAKTEDDFASLEVHVYEESTGNFFVHHDIVLPAFPLCLAHGDISPQGVAGNFVAVGSFSPGIEVWNLDVLNPLEPSCILGGEDTSAADELMKLNMMRAASGKRLKNQHFQRGGLRVGSHTDAVMALSWNKTHRQVIASGSADKTVKIWDITKAGESKANAATFTHHRDKVQAVVWHPSEGTLLATGSYDRSVAVLDARSSDTKKVKISADIEALAWDPHHSHYLTAATEDGVLSCWDVRNFSDPVWSFVVEEYGGVSDLSYNP